MRMAMVTCERPIERDDDLDFIVPALRRRDVEVEAPGWTDASIDWSSFDVAMLSSTWDYHERPEEFRAWLRTTASATLLRNPLEILEWNLDKGYLRELESAGVLTIPTVWSQPGEEAEAAAEIEELGWEDVVIKPVIDLGARNLVRIESSLVGTMLPRFGVATMAQPYVSSVATEGELSLVYLGGDLSHSLRKLPARGDFRVQPQYGGTHEAWNPSREAVAIATSALASTPGEPLYARVDLVRLDSGELALIELELIEPALYLDVAPRSAEALAAALLSTRA